MYNFIFSSWESTCDCCYACAHSVKPVASATADHKSSEKRGFETEEWEGKIHKS